MLVEDETYTLALHGDITSMMKIAYLLSDLPSPMGKAKWNTRPQERADMTDVERILSIFLRHILSSSVNPMIHEQRLRLDRALLAFHIIDLSFIRLPWSCRGSSKEAMQKLVMRLSSAWDRIWNSGCTIMAMADFPPLQTTSGAILDRLTPLSFFADLLHSPLMGQVTTRPDMLQKLSRYWNLPDPRSPKIVDLICEALGEFSRANPFMDEAGFAFPVELFHACRTSPLDIGNTLIGRIKDLSMRRFEAPCQRPEFQDINDYDGFEMRLATRVQYLVGHLVILGELCRPPIEEAKELRQTPGLVDAWTNCLDQIVHLDEDILTDPPGLTKVSGALSVAIDSFVAFLLDEEGVEPLSQFLKPKILGPVIKYSALVASRLSTLNSVQQAVDFQHEFIAGLNKIFGRVVASIMEPDVFLYALPSEWKTELKRYRVTGSFASSEYLVTGILGRLEKMEKRISKLIRVYNESKANPGNFQFTCSFIHCPKIPRATLPLVPCPSCHGVLYCSEQCLKINEPFHSTVCSKSGRVKSVETVSFLNALIFYDLSSSTERLKRMGNQVLNANPSLNPLNLIINLDYHDLTTKLWVSSSFSNEVATAGSNTGLQYLAKKRGLNVVAALIPDGPRSFVVHECFDLRSVL